MQFPCPSMFDSTLKCKLCCDKADKKEGHGKGAIEGGEQGWRSGESTPLPPMWPRFNFQSRSCVG